MADTRIADIIVPEVFNPYFIERTAELSALYQSGIVQPDSRIDALAASGGTIIQMPQFSDLGRGESQVLSDSTPLTLSKIGTQQENAHVLMRGNAWGTNDLAKALSGADPQAAIADLVASYWASDFQTTLVAMLNGLFAGPLSTTHRFDVPTLETGATPAFDKLLNTDNAIEAFKLLGDNAEGSLNAFVMHSVPFYNLVKQKLIEYVPVDSSGISIEQGDQRGAFDKAPTVPMFLGRRVIVDDGVAKRAGSTSGTVYSTYLFGAGSIGLGRANAPVPTETDRDSLGGVDILVNRVHYVLHPRGTSFTHTAGTGTAKASPTNAELNDSAKWAKVWEDKNIHIVELRTNG